MEELRSTEIIDKEIIADAERKAERIVLKADDEVQKIEASVEKRVLDEVVIAENNLKNKLANFKRDLNASVALENSRFFVSYIQNSVVKNINDFLKNIPDEKIIDLLVRKTEEVNFSDNKLNVFVYGLDEKSCEAALKKNLKDALKSVQKTVFNKVLFEDSVLEDENNKGIIIFSENEEIKCRFTMCSIIEDILDKNRAELAEKLFGNLSVKNGQEA